MASTYKYKRFIIPLSGDMRGRCLCEFLQNGNLRVTLSLKCPDKRPLNLWIFGGEKAAMYPKTLYPAASGMLELRGIMPSCGLSDIAGIAFTDENMTERASGFTGGAVDWQALLQKGSMAAQEPISDEEFKTKVKDLVKELDENIREKPEETSDWKKITPKDIAADKRLWKYAKNPFVTAEYGKYGHLLYREDAKFCFLAVPCTQSEYFAGAAQGFRTFERHRNGDYAVYKCEK